VKVMTCEQPPQSQCPQCRAWQDDLDGFGVLVCAACGYCEHASQSGQDGWWVCNACNQQIRPLDVPRTPSLGAA
jgi:hypothetical protein